MRHNHYITIIILSFLVIFTIPQISQARNERDGQHCYTTTTISVPGSTSDTLGTDDTDYFAINVTTTGVMTVYTTGSTDTYGYLRDPSCNKIDEDDDSGSGYNFSITYNVTTTGTYYINVEGYSKWDTGNYTVVVEMISDDHGNNCAGATAVATTSVTAGDIETGGDTDYFAVVLPTQGQLKVYTVYTSDNTDTYGNLLTNMILGIAFSEAIAIYCLVIAFLMLFKVV